MFIGKVVGTVWSTVKWPELGGLKLLLVRPYHLDELRAGAHAGLGSVARQGAVPLSEAVVCADLLDAGVGDDVVVAYGHAARVAAWEATLGAVAQDQGAPPVPIDAAVVAVVDRYHIGEEQTRAPMAALQPENPPHRGSDQDGPA